MTAYLRDLSFITKPFFRFDTLGLAHPALTGHAYRVLKSKIDKVSCNFLLFYFSSFSMCATIKLKNALHEQQSTMFRDLELLKAIDCRLFTRSYYPEQSHKLRPLLSSELSSFA